MWQRTFVRAVIGGCAIAAVAHSTCTYAQEVAASDPFRGAPDRLRNLSSFVDTHLKTVQAVNRIANSRTASAAKKSSTSILDIKGIGGTQVVTNMLRSQNLEPRLQPLQIEFLQDHQLELQSFSQTLRQTLNEASSLPPAQAKARFDAIIVPPNVQQLLIQGADGQVLPLPPHMQAQSLSLPTTLTPYIAGPGSAATVEYPAVSEIAYAWLGHGSSAVCTGTLISTDAVLTAAHCFCELAKVRTAAACASTTYMRGLEPVKATDDRFITVFFHDRGPLAVKEIIIHPDFDFPKKDLAIIKLKETIADIMPAPMNAGRSLRPGEFATIVGFGTHSPMRADGSPAPGAPVRASEGLKLWATVRTASCTDAQLEGAICWNYQEREGDRILGTTCHGDSGGPSFAMIDGALKLVGVTSGGPGDCHAGTDQSYDVDVQKNATWITSVAGANSNPAFAANPNAFVSNPGTRAYGAPYHLFISRPDQSNADFFVPASLGSIRVTVNTTPTFASLRLQVFAPGAQNASCDVTSSDAFASCVVPSPAGGTWRALVTGSGPQESQVVATASR